jgi:hypothetical protein
VTPDAIARILAWVGLAAWVTSIVLFHKHSDRAAAAMNAALALPFVIPSLYTLLKWSKDPAAYTRQYGTAALRELPAGAVGLGLSLLTLLGCVLTVRGRRRWLLAALLLNGLGLVFLFYMAFFFHVF